MEEIKKQILKLYKEELADLSIGYDFNQNRIKKMVDLIAEDTCYKPWITELKD